MLLDPHSDISKYESVKDPILIRLEINWPKEKVVAVKYHNFGELCQQTGCIFLYSHITFLFVYHHSVCMSNV